MPEITKSDEEFKKELNNTVKSRKISISSSSSSKSEDSLTKFLNSQPQVFTQLSNHYIIIKHNLIKLYFLKPQLVKESEPLGAQTNPFEEEKSKNSFENESNNGNPFLERDLEEISDEEIDSPKAMKAAKRKALCCACCRRGKNKCSIM